MNPIGQFTDTEIVFETLVKIIVAEDILMSARPNVALLNKIMMNVGREILPYGTSSTETL